MVDLVSSNQSWETGHGGATDRLGCAIIQNRQELHLTPSSTITTLGQK